MSDLNSPIRSKWACRSIQGEVGSQIQENTIYVSWDMWRRNESISMPRRATALDVQQPKRWCLAAQEKFILLVVMRIYGSRKRSQ